MSTSKSLDEVADDDIAQHLLQTAARKKAEYWDALNDLERYVGLSFDYDLSHLVTSINTLAAYDQTELSPKALKRALKKGFRQGGDVLDETGIAVEE